MIPNAVETAKDAMLRTFAAQLRLERPGLSHARSYQIAQEQHPELAEEFDEHPTSQPAYTPPLPGQVAADQAKLDRLLRKLNLPKKVEAKKPRKDEGLERIEAIEPSSSTPQLVRGIDVGLISKIVE